MNNEKNFILIISVFLVIFNALGTIDNKYIIVPVKSLGSEYSVTYEYDENFRYMNYHDSLLFINNNSANDVTYDEILNFISEDQTDKMQYIDHKWNCVNFAQIVHNNAEEKGIRCGLVTISYKDKKTAHALNVFNTTDKGLIYIDCTGSHNVYDDINLDKEIDLNLNDSFKGYYLDNSGSFNKKNNIIRAINIYY